MPLFNGPQGTNAVDYSHTSVFTASYNMLPPTLSNNVPPLTTIYTAPSSCTNRWMLNMTKTDTEAPFSIAFSRDLTFTLDDPLYIPCQPFTVAPTFSPGVCPDGHTLAEVTEHQVAKTAGGMDRYWQASCCQSGFGFGTATKGLCYSSVSSSLLVQATISGESDGTWYAAYEFNNRGSTVKKMVVMSTGLAIADPVTVGWQLQDIPSFPSAYASSLSKIIGVSAQETPAPGSFVSSGPSSTGQPTTQETAQPSPSSPSTPTPPGLSVGAKAGIAIGVISNFVIIGAILAFIFIRRSKKKAVSAAGGVGEVHEMPQEGEKSDLSFSGGTSVLDKRSDVTSSQELEAGHEIQEIGWSKEVRRKGSELDSRAVHVVTGAPIELDASNSDHIGRSEKNKSPVMRAEKQVF